ncbi:hypothetical protein BGX34_001273 [Mortierella sp. NVP85]|nr:hypothetical protein BGX34_001273 [Mortierella sp. NVP85]
MLDTGVEEARRAQQKRRTTLANDEDEIEETLEFTGIESEDEIELSRILYSPDDEAPTTATSSVSLLEFYAQHATCSRSKLDQRIKRFQQLERSRFWRLRSGRAVEDVLFMASLQENAPVGARLYKKTPSPFTTKGLSEAYWARTSWPLMKDLLDNTPGILMVDREKAGVDSTRRRNRRRTEEDASVRRRIGRKLDLVGRNFIRNEDWMIIESMNSWDPTSPKFLTDNVDLFRELRTIMAHRLK